MLSNLTPEELNELRSKIDETLESIQEIKETPTDYLELAIKYIDDYLVDEFGSSDNEEVFEDLSSIGIGYTTLEDDSAIPIQAIANLKDYRIERYLEDVLIETRQYDSLKDLVEFELKDLSFEDLVYVSDNQLAMYYEKTQQNRLEKLKNYKSNEDLIKEDNDQKLKAESDKLIEEIKALRPRIDVIIKTGNACLMGGIPIENRGWGGHEGYDTNHFMTNSWSHLTGFVHPVNNGSRTISMLGITAGGACGMYDFRTDGIQVYSVNERNNLDIVTPSTHHMKRFLNEFDEFESTFYAYVDKMLEKQDKKIAAMSENKSTSLNDKISAAEDRSSKDVTHKETKDLVK